jgi:hypothetical protein
VSSALFIVTPPEYPSHRNISAAALPAAPPPTMMTFSGAFAETAGRFFSGCFSRTKSLPPLVSTFQQMTSGPP